MGLGKGNYMNQAKNLLTFLEKHVQDRPHDPFLHAKKNSNYEAITFLSLYQSIAQLSAALSEMGISNNDKVAILSNNRPEWVMTDLAVLSLSAVVVPIYPTVPASDIAYIINHSGSKIIVLENQEMIDKVLSVKDQCPNLERIVFIESNVAAAPEICTPFSKLLQQGIQLQQTMAKPLAERIPLIESEQLATIIYTSGTTGVPKGAQLTHANFTSNIQDILLAFELDERDSVLSFLPLSHVFERTIGYYMIMAIGGKIFYARSIQTVIEDVVDASPSVFISVPRLYEKIEAGIKSKLSLVKKAVFFLGLYVGRHTCMGKPYSRDAKHPFLFRMFQKLVFKKVKDKLGGNIRFFVSGGAPLSKSVFEFFECMGFPVVEGYGLTETSPCIAGSRLNAERKAGSVGQVLDSQEISITEEGELIVKGPNVMQGYYNPPENDVSPIKKGWFHTGDVAHVDDDGYIFIKDRIKEIIVLSNGKNVAPQPIETLIKNNPYISQVMLVGDNRSYITALIVPDIEILTKSVRIKSHADPRDWLEGPQAHNFFKNQIQPVMQKLASYEQIKRFAVLPHEFTQESGELTPTLKLKRRVIQEKYTELIDSLYPQSE